MNIKTHKIVRHTDQRGWLAEFLKSDSGKRKMPVKQIYISYSKKNAIRGGHYHKRKTEWFSVIRGKAHIFLEDLKTHEKESIELTEENLLLLEIPPYVYHRVKSLTDGMLLFVASSEVFNEEDPDTYS